MKHETTAHLAATLLAADVQFLHVSDHEKERRREQALHQARLLLQEARPAGVPMERINRIEEADFQKWANPDLGLRYEFDADAGREVVSMVPGPAVTVQTDAVVHQCRKVVVRATLVTRGGKVFASENHVQHDPGSCPREGMAHGEGYHLCRDICRQPGHAETNVLGMAGALARGGVVYLEGHDRLCEGCREACSRAEVTVVRADGVVLLQPITSEKVTFYFAQTQEELQP